jgi:hypothetical protein
MRSHMLRLAFLVGIVSMASLSSEAGPTSVLDATAMANADGTYSFSVTLTHRDEGWNHYANKWEVVTPEGRVIGTRTLYHPHVNEQPFTRSLARVEVPIGVTEVIIRGFDNVHGAGERTFNVKLPPRK